MENTDLILYYLGSGISLSKVCFVCFSSAESTIPNGSDNSRNDKGNPNQPTHPGGHLCNMKKLVKIPWIVIFLLLWSIACWSNVLVFSQSATVLFGDVFKRLTSVVKAHTDHTGHHGHHCSHQRVQQDEWHHPHLRADSWIFRGLVYSICIITGLGQAIKYTGKHREIDGKVTVQRLLVVLRCA